jgi:hypothetical protein
LRFKKEATVAIEVGKKEKKGENSVRGYLGYLGRRIMSNLKAM